MSDTPKTDEKPSESAKSTDTAKAGKKPRHRFETFERTRPNGTVAVVKRNIDTGEQTVTDKK